MGEYGMTPYYSEKLKQGQEYQDFVMCELFKQGIIIQPFSSSKYQREVGESISRYEIKYDSRISETGNIYIEVAEKSHPANPDYIKSGVMREDNTIIYCIGDNTHAHLLSKKLIRIVCEKSLEYKQAHGIRFVETETSQGYIIPETLVRKCLTIAEITFSKPFRKEGDIA